MSLYLYILVILFSLFLYARCTNVSKMKSRLRIGIIGGGIGGTATSYFLQNHFADHLDITLFEANKIGGRLATSETFGKFYETGGSVIHSKNEYMNYFIKELGLKKRNACDAKLGIFDGRHFVFHESNWSAITYAELLWRYGFDIFRLRNFVNDMLSSFSKIYKNQREGLAFKSVSELLSSMNPSFDEMVKRSLRDHLESLGFGQPIIQELVSAITLTNYGQSPDIQSFVGSISIAGAGFDLWSVEGGNQKVAEHLVLKSEASVIKENVVGITRTSSGKFMITTFHSEKNESEFDAVVIATPLSQDHSPITFHNFSENFQFSGQFQKIFCCFVDGTLNDATFPFDQIGVQVQEILVCNNSLPFNSVGLQYPVDVDICGSSNIYKIFAPHRVTDEVLRYLFSSYKELETIEWLAYPRYSPEEILGRFELIPGLYYNNAIEWAGSAMEMSVISAKNSALLISKFLNQNFLNTHSKDEL